jgi:ABC-type spermidine/putrescine transport system permease subunit I
MIGNLIDNFFEEAQFAQGATVSVLVAVVVVILLVVFRRSLEVGERAMVGETHGG